MILQTASRATGFAIPGILSMEIWNKEIEDYIKHIMTAEHSAILMCDKLSRQFIWKCFGKAKRGSLLGR